MRPNLVAALLAVGILVLTGGAVFAATRSTWRPARPGAAHATMPAAGAGAAATAGAAHPAVSAAAPVGHNATATWSATAAHRQISPVHNAASSGRSSDAAAAWQARSLPAITYTVKPGDTLSGIAAWFKLHGYGSLYAANRSVVGFNPNLIRPGERITISDGRMTLRPEKRSTAVRASA